MHSSNKPLPLSRRALLALLAVPSFAAPVAGASAKTVAVIGAGLAGLAAARALAAAGARVIVLEARPRTGGRIWTSRDWPHLPLDLGASWIHGVEGNPLSVLADEAGAGRLPTSYESSLTLAADGTEADITDALDEAEGVLSAARKAAEARSTDQALSAAVTGTRQWRAASARQRRMIRHLVNSTVEQEYGGDWTDVSAWHGDDSREFPGGDVLFPDGFDQVTGFLARNLDIRLGEKVTRIAAEGEALRIETAAGATLAADHAVVTVPLGVLQAGDISFSQPLSPARQRAIATLRMGLLNKCWLRFPRIAWPGDVDWIEWLGPRDGFWAEWVSLAQSARLPVLLGFHAGVQAREMEKHDDRSMAAEAHQALKAMFGSSFPAPEAVRVTRWSQDPQARGAYSFNAVGVTPAMRDDLAGADWDGRLVFAGEATSRHFFGTAHGAFLSGLAAADLVLDDAG